MGNYTDLLNGSDEAPSTNPDEAGMGTVLQNPQEPTQTVSAPTGLQQPNLPQPGQGGLVSGAPLTGPAPDLDAPTGWRALLKGALIGMQAGSQIRQGQGGFFSGAGAGAAAQMANVAQEKEAASVQTFRSAQAANMAAEAAMRDQQLHAMPEKMQDEHNANQAELVKTYSSIFGAPTLKFSNTAEGAAAAMKQLGEAGGIQHGKILNTGKEIYYWSLDRADAPGNLTLVNKSRELMNLPPYSAETWASMKEAGQRLESDKADKVLISPVLTKENAPGDLQQAKNQRDTYNANPNATDAGKKFWQDRVSYLETGVTELDKHAVKQAAATTSAQEEAKRQATEPEVESIAKGLLEPGNLTSITMLSNRTDIRARVISRAQEMAKAEGKSFDAGLIDRRIKFIDSYNNPTGRASINRQAVNNIAQHASDLADANNDYLRLNGPRMLNRAINELKPGSTERVRYETISSVLKDELSLYFAGGYAPTAEQGKMWDKIQNGDATPNQTMAFTKEILTLASRRASTFNSGFKSMMGYDDTNLITPDAKQAARHVYGKENSPLEKFESGGQVGAPGSGKSTTQPARQVSQAPQGATHKVPGPDGKMHWTNAQGTVDYGIAQ